LQLLQSLLAFFRLDGEQFIGDVVFVDIRDVGDGFHCDAVGGNHFHVVKPHIGIKSFLACFNAQRRNARIRNTIKKEARRMSVAAFAARLLGVLCIAVATSLASGFTALKENHLPEIEM
jgi:hypothetical protein